MVTRATLLGKLPDFKNEWILLKSDQSVFDIIHEVLRAHKEFSSDYDNISSYFPADNLQDLADDLYAFCKHNLDYVEEPEEEQTVSSPGAMLNRGHCDCKGYANFIGGIISSINRKGDNIDWCYRFASYNLFDTLPHHVFIVVKDHNGKEIWIDPTPGSDNKEPYWYTDKKIKDMPLYKISGTEGATQNYYVTPAKMVWDPVTLRWIYDLNAATVNGFDDLADYGAEAASYSADAVVPGAGSIITSITNFFKNVFGGLFGGPSDPAQLKIWFMFQIPKYNPTKQQLQTALDAAKHKFTYQNPDWDSNWIEAYNNLFKAYQAIIDLISIRDQVAARYNINPSSYGVMTGIGYTSPTGIRLNDEDVIIRVTDPATGPTDLQAIVDTLNRQIAQMQQIKTTTTNTGAPLPGGGGSILDGGSTMPLLIGGGILAFILLKPKGKVTGSANTNLLLIGGAGLALYLLTRPKTNTSETTGYPALIEETTTVNQGILPGDQITTDPGNGIQQQDQIVIDPVKDSYYVDLSASDQYGDLTQSGGGSIWDKIHSYL